MSAENLSPVLAIDSLGTKGGPERSHARLLTEVALLLARSLESPRLLEDIARLGVPAFADWCFVDRFDGEGQVSFERVAVAHARSEDDGMASALRRRYELRRDPAVGVGVALCEGKPSLLRNLDPSASSAPNPSDEELPPLLAAQMRSRLIVPLKARERVVGALSFIAFGRSYDDEDLRFAMDLGQLAGAAIDNARAFEIEQRTRVQLGQLLEVTAALSRASTAEEVAEVVCRLGVEAVSCQSSALWLARADASLVLTGAFGQKGDLLDQFRTIAADTPDVPALEVLHSGESQWVETTDDYRRRAPRMFERARQADHLNAYGALPIALDGRIGGVLVFTQPLGHHFDATERALLGTLAQHCSQALDRARLLEVERKRLAVERRSNARVRLLSEISETLSLSLKIEEKLQVIAKLIVPEQADWCVIDLVDGQDIRRVAIEHRDPAKVDRGLANAARYRPKVGDGSPIAGAIAQGKPHFFPRVSADMLKASARDAEELQEFLSEPVVSALVMPLVVGSQCIGVLSLITSDCGRVYDQEDVAFARELTRRAGTSISNARLRSALEGERAKLRMVFEQAPFPLGVFEGPEHRIVLANSKWEALVRRPLTVGMPLGDAVPELRAQNVLVMHDRAFAGETVVHDEIPLELIVHGKPHLYYFHVVMQPLRNAFGDIDGHVTMALDVTERKLARVELESARRAAEAASRAKDEFLAMLGHELRNPLAPIVSALQLMDLEGADQLSRERNVIARQVQHLTRLVDDLLDVSRIVKGQFELRTSVTELSSVVARALESTGPLFEQQPRFLEVAVPESGLPLEVDAQRMAQVLSNLLVNAVRYSDKGARVSIVATRVEGEVLITVSDSGIGIRPEMLGRIFELFVQEQQASDRALGGLGLGLAIVKSVVTLHGGSVFAESDGPGSGSKFSIRLPLAVNSEARPSERVRATVPQASRPLRILVVDDNEDAADLWALTLEAAGQVVRTAYEGSGALRELQEFNPDAAVLDIGLPGMDGYELAQRIRQERADIRLVALTGYGQQNDLERSRAAGFDAHLVKPAELRLVLGALRNEPAL
ncbi:MAG TPA: GAF domain-containing protein [Polyangiaceae bacterium]|nr:GAF domain-containing protein [Polyangiaceae bacterium]